MTAFLPHVVFCGNLTVGFHAVGPFDDYEQAFLYATSAIAAGHWFIFAVYPPDVENHT